MSSTILNKLEDKYNRSSSKKAYKGGVMLPMADEEEIKPKKLFVRQSTKRSSHSKSPLPQKLKADSTSDFSDNRQFKPGNTVRTGSQPNIPTHNNSDINPLLRSEAVNHLKSSKTFPKRYDYNGNIILRKGKKHKIQFADQVNRGPLEIVVNIDKINYNMCVSSQQVPLINSPNTEIINSKPPNLRKSGDSCSCTCTVF